MTLQDYRWEQKDLSNTEYAGKYVTHDFISKTQVDEILQKNQNGLDHGEHTLYYRGTAMDVRLDVTRNHVQFFYDEKFEDELGDKEFGDVLSHFLTPLQWRGDSALE